MTMRVLLTPAVCLVCVLLVAFHASAAEGDTPADSAHESREVAASSSGDTPDHAGGGHATGHGGAATLNPMDFRSDLAIWTSVVFLVLLIVLTVFAWKPILSGLEKREQSIAEEIASAQRANAEAKKLLEYYQRKMDEAEEDVREMLAEAKHEGAKVTEAVLKQAQSVAEAEKARALRDIEMATTLALEELARHSSTLVVELAQKVVGQSIDPETHTRLIEEAVGNLAKQSPR